MSVRHFMPLCQYLYNVRQQAEFIPEVEVSGDLCVVRGARLQRGVPNFSSASRTIHTPSGITKEQAYLHVYVARCRKNAPSRRALPFAGSPAAKMSISNKRGARRTKLRSLISADINYGCHLMIRFRTHSQPQGLRNSEGVIPPRCTGNKLADYVNSAHIYNLQITVI